MSGMGVIKTIRQNCRRCYTCVKNCPAKAIKIEDGQAWVIEDRCIGCGNCTVVCTQGAKTYQSDIEKVLELLEKPEPTAALLAPSFPTEFHDISPGHLAALLKGIGFTRVIEVASGADAVSRAYRDFLHKNNDRGWIASACPAVCELIRKYYPHFTDNLVPIVSPMIATGMMARELYGPEINNVFIGPCIAKKMEALEPETCGIIDGVLTFEELRSILEQSKKQGVTANIQDEIRFDAPEAGLGRAFPVSGGLLKSAEISWDFIDTRMIIVAGHEEVAEILSDFESETVKPHMIEPLMCRACYEGPGMTRRGHVLDKKEQMVKYIQCNICDTAQKASDPQMMRDFKSNDQRIKEPSENEIKSILAKTNKFSIEDELNCGACGYPTCRDKAAAVHKGLAEETMCLPFMIDEAERICQELNIPRRDIKDIHRHIIDTEKLASMGQLSAGIAHELNNPLGTILLYTHLILKKLKNQHDVENDLKLLVDEAQRCKKIVGGLLDFARQNRVKLDRVDLKEFIDSILKNSFNPTRLKEEGIVFCTDFHDNLPNVDIDRDQMTQVLVNLIENAVEAINGPNGRITVTAQEVADGHIRISIADNGPGISDNDKDCIFQPFFTTKHIGKGTGLGLPISYGIVKMHRGSLWFETEQGQGTEFHIDIPKTQAGGGAWNI